MTQSPAFLIEEVQEVSGREGGRAGEKDVAIVNAYKMVIFCLYILCLAFTSIQEICSVNFREGERE